MRRRFLASLGALRAARVLPALAATGLLLAAAGCQGTPLQDPTAARVANVTRVVVRIAPEAVGAVFGDSAAEVGTARAVRAVLYTRDGDSLTTGALDVAWRTTDGFLARVDAARGGMEGTLVALGPGQVDVIARAPNGVEGRARFVVQARPAATIALTPADTTMLIPDSIEVRGVVRDAQGRGLALERPLYWTASDPSLATLVRVSNTSVKLVPRGKGTVLVMAATAEDGLGPVVRATARVRLEPDTVNRVTVSGAQSATLNSSGKNDPVQVLAIGVSPRGRKLPGSTYDVEFSDARPFQYLGSSRALDGSLVILLQPVTPGTTTLRVTIDGVEQTWPMAVLPPRTGG